MFKVLNQKKAFNCIYYPKNKSICLSKSNSQELKKIAKKNINNKSRFCVHRSPRETLHKMLIFHTRLTNVPPHKHLQGAETIVLLEGSMELYLFNKNGKLRKIINMKPYQSNRTFLVEIPANQYHSLKILSKYVIFLEFTKGPFSKKNMIIAPWGLT